MRSHRRRTPLQHVLIAGSAVELPCMRSLISMLPSDAYGQVLVEADADEQIGDLGAPARVTVQRIRPTTVPSEALTAAVSAWIEEWMPGLGDPHRVVALWVGAGADADVDARWHHLGDLLPETSA